jgi:acetate kinase
MAGAPIVLCLNAGSSSLKFSVWDGDDCLGEGEVEEIGRPGAFAWLRPPGEPARRLPGR